MKTAKRATLIIVILALLFIGANCLVITNENQYSLIRQFGKVDHVVDHAGVSFRIPFIQSVDTLPKETLLYDLSSSDVITSDKKTMICNSYILWHITDPQLFAQTLNSSIANAEGRLDTVVYNSTKNVISSTTQDDVISGRDGALSEAIIASIGNTLDQYGIELLAFEIKQLDLPSDNKAAVYELRGPDHPQHHGQGSDRNVVRGGEGSGNSDSGGRGGIHADSVRGLRR